ncbi:hypothetical protein CJ030_MR5G005110 [Morella rubra]|uniref:Uncharacterized protein n=1 Tax=Morella rubra TaxID=262757 RepID=A0A6A1VJJ0_9ROSI|nr:hypothetical protein CJ030_MR5G005110 [Morella rubra]
MPNVDGRTHSTECPFTRAQCMHLLGQHTWIDFLLYMFELIMDDAWGIKDNSLPYGVFLTQFHIHRGGAIGDEETRKEVLSMLKKFTLSKSRGQEGALTQRFARRAAVAVKEATQALTDTKPTRSEVSQQFTDLDNRVGVSVKTALQPLQEQVDKLTKEVQELEMIKRSSRPPLKGSALLHCCTTSGRGSYEGGQRTAERNQDDSG